MKCQECGKEIVLTISRILFWGCREMLCAKCAQGREDLKKVAGDKLNAAGKIN